MTEPVVCLIDRTTPGDFRPLQAPTTLKAQSAQAPSPDPPLRELATPAIRFSAPRARDRLAPGGRMAFVPPCAPRIQEAAS
jgi:hypothetical protein